MFTPFAGRSAQGAKRRSGVRFRPTQGVVNTRSRAGFVRFLPLLANSCQERVQGRELGISLTSPFQRTSMALPRNEARYADGVTPISRRKSALKRLALFQPTF